MARSAEPEASRQRVPDAAGERLPQRPAPARPSGGATLRRAADVAAEVVASFHPPGTTVRRLVVGDARSPYEREADRVAADVVRRLGGTPSTAETVGGGAMRRGGVVDDATDTRIRRAMRGGEPLEQSMRGRFEPAMGSDLGHVRLHRDAEAHDLATGVAAQAFTVGSHVFLGAGADRSVGTRRGDALLAHEFAHTLQPASDVRRVALSPDEVLKAVTQISFIKKKLAETLHYERGANARESTDPIREHVSAVLAEYQQHLAGADGARDEAMALSIVMEAVGRVLAFNVLNDPMLAPRLASELITIYGPELRKKLKKSDDVEATLDLAQVIVSDDPLRLYLHNELRADYAARRIRSMAFAAGVTPDEMFTMLRQRFDVDMAARTRTQIGAEEDKKDAYNVKSATGEMSAEWFTSLFGDTDTAQWKGDDSGLDYTPAAQARLDALQVEVRKAPSSMAAPSDRAGLTWKQSHHLDEVAAADTQRNAKVTGAPSVDDRVAAAIASAMKVSPTEADEIVALVRTGLASLPMTLTVNGDAWFSSMKKRNQPTVDKDASDFDYAAGSSRRKSATYKEVYGRASKGPDGQDSTIAHYGQWEKGANDTQDRGANYNRFRGWKDQVMTGNRGLSDEELPTFAAVNPNWAAYGSQGTDAQNYGVNSYGNLHFLLDRTKVGNRLVYTATDHGEPHTDPFLAFADFLLAGKAESRTGLKDIKSLKKVAYHVINAVVLGKQAELVALGTQFFEVQIFGGVNMTRDVSEVWHAPSLTPGAVANLQEFKRQFGIEVKAVPSPVGVVVRSEGVFAGQMQQFAAKVQAQLT